MPKRKTATDLSRAIGRSGRTSIATLPAGYTTFLADLQRLVGELNPERPATALTAIPWGQNVVLLQKLKDLLLRLWYADKALEHGGSRAVLTHHIESHLHKREAKALTNFQRTLPPPQSDAR